MDYLSGSGSESLKVAVKIFNRFQLSEGLTGVEGFLSKMVHSHAGGRKPQFFSMWASP